MPNVVNSIYNEFKKAVINDRLLRGRRSWNLGVALVNKGYNFDRNDKRIECISKYTIEEIKKVKGCSYHTGDLFKLEVDVDELVWEFDRRGNVGGFVIFDKNTGILMNYQGYVGWDFNKGDTLTFDFTDVGIEGVV